MTTFNTPGKLKMFANCLLKNKKRKGDNISLKVATQWSELSFFWVTKITYKLYNFFTAFEFTVIFRDDGYSCRH